MMGNYIYPLPQVYIILAISIALFGMSISQFKLGRDHLSCVFIPFSATILSLAHLITATLYPILIKLEWIIESDSNLIVDISHILSLIACLISTFCIVILLGNKWAEKKKRLFL